MNAIILCGGLSTRLGDITKNIPKILLKIKGKTVLEWQVEKLKKIGIKEVVLAAGHLSGVLFEKVGLKCNGVGLIYAIEETRLGTGGAIKHALEYVNKKSDPTIILNGDVLTEIDFGEIVRNIKIDSDGIIFGAKVEDAFTYGTLVFDKNGRLLEFKEKEGRHEPGFINGGIYIFNERVNKYFPDQDSFSIEYDVFPNMKDLYVYPSDKAWIDIGVPERLEWAEKNWNEIL